MNDPKKEKVEDTFYDARDKFGEASNKFESMSEAELEAINPDPKKDYEDYARENEDLIDAVRDSEILLKRDSLTLEAAEALAFRVQAFSSVIDPDNDQAMGSPM